MCALFIKCDNNNKYNCNICTETIENDKVIGLKCDPKKHIFCYDCILDWFKILKKKHGSGNYSTLNMCPICRKNGGLLPVCDGYETIKNIHNLKLNKQKVVTTNDSKNLINPNKLKYQCGFKLLNGNGYCKFYGFYEGLCGKHKDKKNLLPNNIITIGNSTGSESSTTEPSININPDKLENECGMKLKSKDGFCKLKCNQKYGGFCFIHGKNYQLLGNQNNVIENNNNVLVL
jgi:hypothetical protein